MEITKYAGQGLQAFASLEVLRVPTGTPKVTIAGVDYTFGTHFVGITPEKIAVHLVRAINAEPSMFGDHGLLPVPKSYRAIWTGKHVVLVALVPGTAGNTLTLTTDETVTFAVSGGTFSGGVAGVSSGGSTDAGITVRVTPAISASAIYASGDAIGPKIQFIATAKSASQGVVIQNLTLFDKDSQNSALDILFFASEPTGGTYTDNAAMDANADIAGRLVGIVSIAAVDYKSIGTGSVAAVANIGLYTGALSGGTGELHAAILSRGTPTYTTTSALALSVNCIQDN